MKAEYLRTLLVGLAVFLSLVLVGWFTWMDPRDFLVRFGIGDALAYPQIAWHIAHGEGSTFDGLQVTNGYHPLWMWLHLPFASAAQTPWDAFKAARLLWFVAGFAAAGAWALWLGKLTRSSIVGACVMLVASLSGWSVWTLYSGLETPLALLGLVASLATVGALTPQSGKLRALLTGVVLGLSLLARLDAAFVLVLLGLLALWRVRRTPSAASLLAGAAAITVLPYFAWNVFSFGALTPVSGQLKTQSGVISFQAVFEWASRAQRSLDTLGITLSPTLLLGAAIVVAIGLGALVVVLTRPPVEVVLLGLGASAHWLYYAARMTELNVPWHLYPQFAFALALLAYVISRTLSRWSSPSAETALVLGLFALCLTSDGLWYALKSPRRAEVMLALDAGVALDAKLPPGTTYLMTDSWFTAIRTPQLHAVDATGLVGDRAMVKPVREHDQDALIARFGAEIVVTRIPIACNHPSRFVVWMGEEALTPGPFRYAAVDANAWAGAWRALTPEERFGPWGEIMAQKLLCLPEPA